MDRDEKFAELIRAATDEHVVSADLERRVMMEVARRAIERSRRRARRGMVASLSGLAMLLAGSIAALVVWSPALMPAFTRMSWLEKVRIPAFKFFERSTSAGDSAATLPFFEQWGGLMLLVLLLGGAVGFIYYLNTLFSNDSTLD